MSLSRSQQILERGRNVLTIEASALTKLASELSDSFVEAVELILNTRGRVILSGMGKSGHIAKKIAATMASTGTPAYFVHPAEASHGDLGMITQDDICVIISNSGETTELRDIVSHAKRFNIPLIGIGRRKDSTLLKASNIALVLPDTEEACTIGMAPTTSTTATLALGDALAVSVMELRGFKRENFGTFHPGGKLGAQLLSVKDLMHTGSELPLVQEATPMSETILVMTAKTFGVAGLVDENNVLLGVITDGDLRRNMDRLFTATAGDVASRKPKSTLPDVLAVEALSVMNDNKVSSLFVVDTNGKAIGLLRIHDCLRAGVR